MSARGPAKVLLEAMAADPEREWTAEDAAEAAGNTVKAASQILRRWFAEGSIERVKHGRYRWAGGESSAPAEEAPKRRAKAAPDSPDLTRLRWLAEGYSRGLTTAESIAEEACDLFGVVTP